MKFDNAINTSVSSSSYTIFDEGIYNVEVISTEDKNAKNNTDNIYTEFVYEIIGPEDTRFLGEKYYDRFNVVNSNPKTVEIARENLGRQGNALGLEKEGIPYNDTELAIGRRMDIKIIVKENPVNGNIENQIKGYFQYSGNPKAKAKNSVAPASKPVVSAPKAMPWKR